MNTNELTMFACKRSHPMSALKIEARPKANHNRNALLLCSLLLLTIAPRVVAGNVTWNGYTDVNWSTALNWVGGVAPAASDSLFFSGALNTSANNDIVAGTAFNSITFNTHAAGFTLGGNSLNLAGNLTNNSLNAQTVSLPIALTATRNINVASQFGSLTLSGVISETGGTGFGLTKTGNGLLSLTTSSETYTGPTTVSGGTLAVDTDDRLGTVPGSTTAGSIVLNGGGLRTTASINPINAFRGMAVGSTSGSGSGTLDVASGFTSVYNGIIANNGAGTGGLTKTGAGTLALGGASTFTDATTDNQGMLTLDFTQAGAPTTSILYNGVPAGGLILGGYSSALAAPSQAITAPTLTLTGNASANNSQTFSGLTVNQGMSQITTTPGASGNVLLTLGAITHNLGGVVKFNQGGTLANGVNAINTSTANDASGILGGWAIMSSSANWASVDANGNIVPYAGYTTVADAGTIASSATSNVKCAGAATMAASGVTDINTLQDTHTAVKTLGIGAGKTLRLGAKGAIYRTDTSVAYSSTKALTIGVAGATAGSLTAGGADNIAGEITFVPTTFSGNGGAFGITVNSTITNNGSGVVSVVLAGSATLDVEGTNTYTGNTYINQGRWFAPKIQSFGGDGTAAGSGTVYIQNGAQALIGGGSGVVIANNFVVAGNGTTENASFGVLRLDTPLFGTSSSTLTLAGDSRIGSGANPAAAVIASKITGSYSLDLGNSANNLANAFTLNNTANDFSGNLSLNGSATNVPIKLKLGASQVIPNGPGKGNVSIVGASTAGRNATLDLNGFNETINGLLSPGAWGQTKVDNSSATAVTLTLGDGDATATFGGIIQNTGGSAALALTKIGKGTQTLQGANTYGGATTISSGTLALGSGGSLANSSSITVGSGATFDVAAISFTLGSSQSLLGQGTVHGAVTTSASAGSAIYSGTAGTAGTLSFDNTLNMGAGGSVYFDISTSAGSGNDQILATNLTLSGSDTIHISTLNGAAALQTADYVLFAVANAPTMATTPVLQFDGTMPVNHANFSLAMIGNNVVLHYTPSAAPSVAVALTPSTVVRNQSVIISATVTPGGGTVTGVGVDLSAIGGASPQALVNNGGNNWSWTNFISASITTGTHPPTR